MLSDSLEIVKQSLAALHTLAHALEGLNGHADDASSQRQGQLREIIAQITQQLLVIRQERDSIFYGYQRLVPVTTSLLHLSESGARLEPALSDFSTIVSSILLFEQVTKDEEYEIMAKFTLMRHSVTQYTNVGIDLTEDGQRLVLDKKELLCSYADKEKETLILLSSHAARAKGTLGLVFPEEQRYANDLIGHMLVRDPAKALEWINANIDPKLTPAQRIAAMDTHYVMDTYPVELFAPRGETEEKFFYAAEVALRQVSRMRKKGSFGSKIPHFFAVSHFEFLNHFLMAVFNLQAGNTLSPAEHIEITVLGKKGEISKTLVPLIIRFRNSVARAFLDRQKHSIRQWTVHDLMQS